MPYQQKLYEGLCKLKELTHNLKEPGDVFMDLFFNMPVLVSLMSSNGHFIKVSKAWCELLDMTEQEIYAKPWIEFLHPEDVQRSLEVAEKMIAGIQVDQFKNRYQAKDGTYRFILWNVPYFGESGLSFCTSKHVEEDSVK